MSEGVEVSTGEELQKAISAGAGEIVVAGRITGSVDHAAGGHDVARR